MSGNCSLEVSRLIAEVHRKPELWDRQHPQHHNRSVVDHQWDGVSSTLGITSKAARGKWKNLKDHFRKEYKRCMTSVNSDQEMSRWPYFCSMMFIREQILHKATNPVYLSDFQYQNIYPEVEMGVGADEDNPLNCLSAECENQNAAEANNSECANHDENISDDKHFLLSLIPMFSVLSPEKKLKARIAIETSLLNIAYPDLSGEDDDRCQDEQNGTSTCKSPTKAEKRKRTSEDKPLKKRTVNTKKCY